MCSAKKGSREILKKESLGWHILGVIILGEVFIWHNVFFHDWFQFKVKH